MLNQDYELTREDIQLLSSKDALAALFAKLGYDTNKRLVQNIAALGITGDILKSNITHIERLASQDARMFEVYLFELKSVTVATTQAIVRNFRDRSGDYLLVLTDDYQRLDFVLVQRYSADHSKPQETFGLPTTSKQVGVRPRVLTVYRLKPDDVALRVLRRFSYTESDTIAQYEKLLSAYDVADWSEPFFNNRALFSDYYLITRLPDSPEWNSLGEAGAMTRAFQELRELYADVRETFSNKPEQVTRSRLLEPVLTRLGFAARPVKASNSGTPEPDYRLYMADTVARAAAKPDKPLALCLAYKWGRNLDGKDEQRDNQTPDENPGAVVVNLLDSGEADWAIVTNGKIWRLYSAKAHSRATNYYEIDLEETLAQPPTHREDAFRYFWLFFRSAAFLPTERFMDGEKRLMCFLDSLMSESERYARELGERLKERVFFEIFPHFARGFIIYARRAGQLPANLDSLGASERNSLLEPYFSATLTFLYRLLFLLYAESRDLLPVREVRGYSEKSLERIKREVAAKAGTIVDQAPGKLKNAYNDLSTAFYDRLQELFQAVDKGNAALNVPVYNGGLFMTQPDPQDTSPEADVARFLATCKIPDRELAQGLDLMARDIDEKRHDLAFIDYKSLGVRQLGSIYEGLLEFKLRIAPEVMAVVKGKKTEETVPYAEAQQKKLLILKEGRGKDAHDKTLSKGTVYLENDRRERKATGSYYTPDYIVKYIVEHTVGPVLTEKLEALRPLFREAEKTLKAEREKVKALGRKDISPENETYKKFRKTLNEAFFDLKVLDPAMGSGHFLVEAVDYITDQLAKILTAFRWNPIVHELAQTRQEIQQEMERQGVTIDMSKLTDLNLLKRRVLKSCIYGVDLNPMAVELAKVSLWLDCFTLGAPLSFLDHHMKCGNSLIGGSVQEVQDALSRDLFGHQFAGLLSATQLMRKVGELSDVTAEEVAASRKAYKGAYDALAPFKRLLDVWVSEYFGNKKARITTSVYAGAIVADNYSKANPQDKQAIETALALAKTKRFFHWELEFPEVFFDESKRRENGGFDAVVGNPPWGASLDKFSTIYISTHFQSATANNDTYTALFENSIKYLRLAGRIGQIVPDAWTTGTSYQPMRKKLLASCLVTNLVDLPYDVFKDAYVDCMILIAQKVDKPHYNDVVVIHIQPHEQAETIIADSQRIRLISSHYWIKDDENAMRLSWTDIDYRLYFKIRQIGIGMENLIELASGVTAYGASGHSSSKGRIYHSSRKQSDEWIPFFTGSCRRYSIEHGIGEYLHYGVHLVSYPEPRFFNGKRLFIRRMISRQFRMQASITSEHFAIDDSSYFGLPRQSEYHLAYILSVFNSKLLSWFQVSGSAIALRDDYPKLTLTETRRIPIRHINFTTSSEQCTYYLEKAKNLYAYCLDKNDQACVLGFVDHHLSQQPEQSDVVHDLLAFLAEEMIRLNKEKRAMQKEFLDWLVTTLRILPDKEGRKGIDVLTGKGKIADYPGDYQKGELHLEFGELYDILLKNKGRLGVSLSDAGLVERVRREYEGSLERVLPLKERLAKTDALIDAVVYRLYGLGEEEIGVVEGRK